MRTDVRAGSSLAAVRKALVSIGWISPAPPSSLCLATVVSHWFLGSPSSFLSCLGKDRFSSPHFLQPPFPFTDYLPLKCLSIFQTWLSLDPWHGFFVERNQSPRIWRHERASTMRNEHNSCFFSGLSIKYFYLTTLLSNRHDDEFRFDLWPSVSSFYTHINTWKSNWWD